MIISCFSLRNLLLALSPVYPKPVEGLLTSSSHLSSNSPHGTASLVHKAPRTSPPVPQPTLRIVSFCLLQHFAGRVYKKTDCHVCKKTQHSSLGNTSQGISCFSRHPNAGFYKTPSDLASLPPLSCQICIREATSVESFWYSFASKYNHFYNSMPNEEVKWNNSFFMALSISCSNIKRNRLPKKSMTAY